MTSDYKLNKEVAMQCTMKLTQNNPEQMKLAEEVINTCVGISVPGDK